MAISQRRAVNSAATTDAVPVKQTPRVRWVVEDTSKTESADKPVSVSIIDTFDDRILTSDHRAHSLPNLVDDDWTKADDDGNTGTTPQPVAMATDVTVTSALMPAASLMTSSSLFQSQMTKSNVSSNNRKTKRAASFAEHPVISAVSVLPLFCYLEIK